MGFSGIASDSDKKLWLKQRGNGCQNVYYVWLLESYDPISIVFNNYYYNCGHILMWFLVDLSMLENPVNHSGLENYFKIGFCPPGNCSLKEIVLSSICLTTIIFSISLIWYSWDVEWTEGKFNCQSFLLFSFCHACLLIQKIDSVKSFIIYTYSCHAWGVEDMDD